MNKCFYCELTFGSPISKGIQFITLRRTTDHIIPLGMGGVNLPINKVDSCQQCNHLKGCKMPEYFSHFLKLRIKATQKGIHSSKCFSVKRLEVVLSNNNKLIAQIQPYKESLIKTYSKVKLSEFANRNRNETLKAKTGKEHYPVSLALIKRLNEEPEPNFHYEQQIVNA